MNFLAHAHLSPPIPAVLLGNMVADFVRGRARLALPPEMQVGIALHRHIDAYTDTHPQVLHCAALLEPRWGRYSVVLVDIFFDYVLAKHWGEHSVVRLGDFIPGVYDVLWSHREMLPERARLATGAMVWDDWLSSYARISGIRLALKRLTQRLRHDIDLAPAVEDLEAHLPALEQAFAVFFPQLKQSLRAEGIASSLYGMP